MKRVLASAAVVGAAIGVLPGSLACLKPYRLQPPADFPEAISTEIAGRSLHAGDNLLVDLDSHKLFGEIRNGELHKLRLEVDGEKLDELSLGALARRTLGFRFGRSQERERSRTSFRPGFATPPRSSSWYARSSSCSTEPTPPRNPPRASKSGTVPPSRASRCGMRCPTRPPKCS